MATLSRDTSSEAEQLQFALLREAPLWRKLQMVCELNHATRELALGGLRQRYPNASAPELQRRLADLLLGPELAEKVCGPLTDVVTD